MSHGRMKVDGGVIDVCAMSTICDGGDIDVAMSTKRDGSVIDVTR